jgi:uncharacterized protein YdaU (DUF1376 family)
MHYYQFNIGDYVSHTRHLSPIEDIAYRRLLDAYYLSERPLNSGLTSVARQIGMREHEEEVGLVLQEFFILGDDGWTSNRADKEIAHYKSKIEQASKAGKASAERRSNGRSTDVQLTTNHKPLTTNQEPLTKVEKKHRGTRLPTELEIPDEYIAFCKQERQDLNPHNVWAQFKDYWIAQPGQKGVKADWPATWRNWVRSQASPKTFVNKFDVGLTTTPPPPNQDAALKRIMEDDKKAVPPSLEILARMAQLRIKTA